MTDAMTRRTFAGSIGAALAANAATQGVAADAAPQPAAAKRWQNGASPWPLCLDTATIRPASLEEKIRIAAKAGFDAIEPWEGELHEYEEKGGSLADLGKRIRDAGLFVPSVIGLWNAIPATREEFDKSLVDSRRRMRQAAAITIDADHPRAKIIPDVFHMHITDSRKLTVPATKSGQSTKLPRFGGWHLFS
jgi:sugar phosphate isomerase/epimerase